MFRAQSTWKALVQPPGCWHCITAPSLVPQIAQRWPSLQGAGAAVVEAGSAFEEQL